MIATEQTVFTYTLTLTSDKEMPAYSIPGVAVLFNRLMRETHENLNDLMPDGLRVTIKENPHE